MRIAWQMIMGHLNKTKYYSITQNSNGLSIEHKQALKNKSETNEINENLYRAKKSCFKSLSNSNFRRKTIRITKQANPQEFDKLFLCYFWFSAENDQLEIKVILKI